MLLKIVNWTRLYPSLFITSLTITPAWAMSTHFYIGGGVGPQSIQFKQSAHITRLMMNNIQDTTKLSGTGAFGDIFAGVAWQHLNYYIAGEFNYDFSNAEFNSSNDEFIHHTFSHTSYKVPQSYGLSIIPGYFVNALTLFYGRLGFANGNIKISTTDSSLKNVNTHQNGFRYGAGIKQTIAKQIDIRMEYSHISYQATRFSAFPDQTLKRTKVTPETNQVEFGVVFNFV